LMTSRPMTPCQSSLDLIRGAGDKEINFQIREFLVR
jgi:hypothetical protein